MTFGTVSITSPAAVGIDIEGINNAITFGDTTISSLGANTTGVDFAGATLNGDVTFATLNISGSSTAGTKGIDFSGQTTAKNVTTTDSGSITGVGIGVDLTNAAITGTFQYGDGSDADGDGAASTITATTPVAIAGVNGAQGTYNFSDVVVTGDTTDLAGISAFWVEAGASGTGARTDPGSLAAAEAANASYIVLLNDPSGGTDSIATTNTNGDDSLSLNANQHLVAFGAGDTINATGVAVPTNLLLHGSFAGTLVNPFAASGAPILTNSTVATVVTLSTGNELSGLNITGTLAGGSGTAGITGSSFGTLKVQNVTVNTTGQALNLSTGAFGAGSAFTSITSSGGTHNIGLTSVTGTVDLGTGTLSGSSGSSFFVSGGSVSTTYSGDDSGSQTNVQSPTGIAAR